jgi:hypothetical protein
MNVLTLGLSLGIALLSQKKDDKELVAGYWKIDQNYGLAKEAASYDKPMDVIITIKKDGSYIWTSYDPFVEGVGRKKREMKGTFVVNLQDSRLVLKPAELRPQSLAMVCILSEDLKSFVIPGPEKNVNVYQDRRLKFWKMNVKVQPDEKPPATTGGG